MHAKLNASFRRASREAVHEPRFELTPAALLYLAHAVIPSARPRHRLNRVGV
jgi:hypothetical protein